MTYRTMIAPLRSERTDRDLNRSPDVEPKHRTRSRGDASRFERLAAAAEELHGWPALLDILLGVAAPVSRGGGVVPAPIWIDEGMYRTHCMINLALRLEDQMTQQGNRDTWSASCLAKAMALAGRLAELKTLDDHEALPCSELISEIAVGLLQLFRLSDGDLEARIVLENVALTACKRRALILATTALVMQTIIDAMDRGCAPAISIDLAARGSGQWRLAFTEVDVFADDNDARACDDIVDGLADLLGAPNVRRFRRMSEFVTEIDFPCLEVGPSVLPNTSQVSRAVAWAQI
jgi:hypothetical protein